MHVLHQLKIPVPSSVIQHIRRCRRPRRDCRNRMCLLGANHHHLFANTKDNTVCNTQTRHRYLFIAITNGTLRPLPRHDFAIRWQTTHWTHPRISTRTVPTRAKDPTSRTAIWKWTERMANFLPFVTTNVTPETLRHHHHPFANPTYSALSGGTRRTWNGSFVISSSTTSFHQLFMPGFQRNLSVFASSLRS